MGRKVQFGPGLKEIFIASKNRLDAVKKASKLYGLDGFPLRNSKQAIKIKGGF